MKKSGRIERTEGILENIERNRLSSSRSDVEKATSRAAEVLFEPSTSYITSLFNYFGSRNIKDLSSEDLTGEVARFLGLSNLNPKVEEIFSTLMEDPEGSFDPQFRHFIQLAGRVRNENLLRYLEGDPTPFEHIDEKLKVDFENQLSTLMDLISVKGDLLEDSDSASVLNKLLFRIHQRACPTPKWVLNLVAKELEKKHVTEHGFIFGADQREELSRYELLQPLDSLVDQSYRYLEGSGDLWAKFSVESVNYPGEGEGPLNVTFHLGLAHEGVENPAESLVPLDLSDLGPLDAAGKTTILTVLTASLAKDESQLREIVVENIIPDLSIEVNVDELLKKSIEFHRSIHSQLGLIEILAGTPKTQSEFKQKLDSTYHKKRLEVLADRVLSYLSVNQDLDDADREKLSMLSQNPQTLFQLLHLGPGKIKEFLQSEIVPTKHENIELFFEQLADYMERYQEDPWDILDHIYMGDWSGNLELRNTQIEVIKNLYQEIYQDQIEEPVLATVFKESSDFGIANRILKFSGIEDVFTPEDKLEIRNAMAYAPEFKAAITKYLDECDKSISLIEQKLNTLETNDFVHLSEEFLNHPAQSGLNMLTETVLADVFENIDALKRNALEKKPEWGVVDYESALDYIESRLPLIALQSTNLSQLESELDFLMPYNLRHYIAADYRMHSISDLEKIRKDNPELFVQYMAFVGACRQAFQKFPEIQASPEMLIDQFKQVKKLTKNSLTLDAYPNEILYVMRARLFQLLRIGCQNYVVGTLRSGINSIDATSFKELDEMKREVLSLLDGFDSASQRIQPFVSEFISQYHRCKIFRSEESQMARAEQLWTAYIKVNEVVTETSQMIFQLLRDRYFKSG